MSLDKIGSQEKAPIIELGKDSPVRGALQDKLKEYESRNSASRYHDPRENMDAILKAEILRRVLAEGSVNTWELSRELAEQYKESYRPADFANACAVIDEYCKTGGSGIIGGTGLRQKR